MKAKDRMELFHQVVLNDPEEVKSLVPNLFSANKTRRRCVVYLFSNDFLSSRRTVIKQN